MSRADPELLPFLPGAIEVLRTPPPAASRLLVWTIALVFAIAVVWACLAKVDTVVVATGELVPDGNVKSIQPLRTGAVSEVHVREGQQVTAGDLLLTLKTDEVDAQHASVSAALRHALATRERALALGTSARDLALGPSADSAKRALAPALARASRGEWQAFQATLAGLRAQATLANANRRKAERALSKTVALLPLMRERETALALLLEKSAIARPEWLRAKEALTSLTHDRKIRVAELDEARSTVLVRTRALEEHRTRAWATWVREQRHAEEEIDRLRHELERLDVLRKQSYLNSPVSGTVAALTVHTVGGVVATASEVMRIVPEGVHLSAEVEVKDRDIGFVSPDDAAIIKLDSFPFIRFGTLDAQIVHIANVSSAETHSEHASFLVQLRLQRQHMLVSGQRVALATGMRLTADIKSGQRRVIEYLLEPVTRGFKEALRER